MSELFTMVAKTYLGLEPVLAEELEALGAKEIREISRGVQFMGDESLMYAANLHLRTATRVLVLLNRFRARNEENLYRSVLQTDWSVIIGLKDSLSVDAQVQSDFFQHTGQTSLKVKDAIVEQVQTKTGRKPNTNSLNPTIRVHIAVYDQDISLFVDTSGDPLVWRGWRINKEEGGYTDVLTAGMIMLSGWRGESPWLDGMCGNGQSLIEAAMIAARIAPGLSRSQFAFQRFSDYNPEVFNAVREKAVAMQRKPKVIVEGWDRSPMTLRIAERHFQAAGVLPYVKTTKAYMPQAQAPRLDGELFLRLTEEDPEYYDGLCGFLKTRYHGWKASIVAPDVPTTKFLGLRPDARVLLSDGPKQYRWSLFNLYEGSEEPGQESAPTEE
jgi:putative N6-adenine-specific DNA methylase